MKRTRAVTHMGTSHDRPDRSLKMKKAFLISLSGKTGQQRTVKNFQKSAQKTGIRPRRYLSMRAKLERRERRLREMTISYVNKHRGIFNPDRVQQPPRVTARTRGRHG